jgi:hypothetical protein
MEEGIEFRPKLWNQTLEQNQPHISQNEESEKPGGHMAI